MQQDEKRSLGVGNTPGHACRQGVGGRQSRPGVAGAGGGYQDVYINSDAPLGALKKSRAPALEMTIAELREMGLSQRWLEVAETIGIEAFLKMWAILDRDNLQSPSERECVRVWIPQMRRYFRFQRNKLIHALSSDGVSKYEIQKIIASELGERISIRHIDRIASRSRAKSLRQK